MMQVIGVTTVLIGKENFRFLLWILWSCQKIKIDHKSEILNCSSEHLNPLLESSVYGIETLVQCIDMIATLLSTFGD